MVPYVTQDHPYGHRRHVLKLLVHAVCRDEDSMSNNKVAISAQFVLDDRASSGTVVGGGSEKESVKVFKEHSHQHVTVSHGFDTET